MSDVLFVAPDLHGGVGRCVAFIADALPQEGVDSALFLLRSRNREYPIANPKVARALPIIESPAKLRMMLPVAFIRLLRYIRQEKPAIVCSHGLLCNMLVVLARKMLRADFKTVAFEHSSPAIHYGASRMRRLKCWLVSQSYRRHDAVVGVSRGVKEDLVSMFPPLRGKVHTIYNGVPLDDVRQQSAHGAKQHNDEQAPYHVVAVGRLEAVKDYATLVDAAALLDDPGIAFTILGEGSEHAALQQRIDNHGSRTKVTLAGHIDNPFPIIASAGAFALTSVRESFGNVLVEALCLGVPVISTDCPHGPAEILDAGRYGLLVPVGNAAALAAAVRRLADDRDLRQQLSEQGPERANVFSLERHCRNVIELFRPMMRNAAGPEQDNTMQKIPVSVVVMTKNEERNIAKCLKALTDFDEVFVVDSNSTDATCAIATSLGAKVSNFQWNGKYPKKKQWCLEQLPFTHEVVLYVDADEEMTPGLADEIREVLPRFASGAGGAFIPFDYVFCGKKLEHGHRVYKLALLARDRSRFLDYDDLDVAHMWEVEGHYQPQVDGEAFALRQRMVHNDHDSLFHYFDKHNRYSDWEANLRTKGLMNDPREANVGARALIKRMFQAMPFKSPIAFLHSYVVRLGFLDGKAGYDYAVARAMYYWQIRIKTEEIQKARQAEAAAPSDDTVAGAAK